MDKSHDEVLALDSDSELRGWCEALVRLLCVANEFESAVTRFGGYVAPSEPPSQPIPPAPVIFPPPPVLPDVETLVEQMGLIRPEDDYDDDNHDEGKYNEDDPSGSKKKDAPYRQRRREHAQQRLSTRQAHLIELNKQLKEAEKQVSPFLPAPPSSLSYVAPLSSSSSSSSSNPMIRLADFPSIPELIALEETLVTAPPSEFASLEPHYIEIVLFVVVEHGDEKLAMQLPSLTVFPDVSAAPAVLAPAPAAPHDSKTNSKVTTMMNVVKPVVMSNVEKRLHDEDQVALKALKDEVRVDFLVQLFCGLGFS